MLRIPERVGLELAQPTPARKAWPTQVGRIDPVTVSAFCLDPQPPIPADYRQVASAAYPAGVCRWDRDDGDRGAVYCLTRDEAAAWCAESRPGGRLPSMLEWESAYRAKLSELAAPVHEWTREPFPSPTLALEDRNWSRGAGMWVRELPGEPPKARAYLALSWNHQDPELRHPERTFRCAAALGPSTP